VVVWSLFGGFIIIANLFDLSFSIRGALTDTGAIVCLLFPGTFIQKLGPKRVGSALFWSDLKYRTTVIDKEGTGTSLFHPQEDRTFVFGGIIFLNEGAPVDIEKGQEGGEVLGIEFDHARSTTTIAALGTLEIIFLF